MKVIISFLLIIIIDLNSFCEANNIIGNSSHRTQVDIINDTSKMPLSPSSADCRNLKVIPFNQCDPSGSWINDYLNPDGYCNGTLNGNKYSVCAFGCALTCLAMLINAYEHSNDLNPDCDPHTLNVFCNIIDNQGNNQGYDGCANIIWSTALQYPGSSTNPQDYGSYSSFDLDAIKVQINNQNPVIMKVTVGGGPHFVIIIGYENDGYDNNDYYLIDPSGGIVKRLSAFSDDCNPNKENLRFFLNCNIECLPHSLKVHCTNCIKDDSEQDVDCGGPDCSPCNTSLDEMNYNSSNDLQAENVANRYINLSGVNGTLTIDGDKLFRCDNTIVISPGVSIPLGSNVLFSLSTDRFKLTRDCNYICIDVPNVEQEPEFLVSTDGITELYLWLYYTGDNQLKKQYPPNGQSCWYFWDGIHELFDISDLTPSDAYNTYWADWQMLDCKTGTWHEDHGWETILGSGKKGACQNDQDTSEIERGNIKSNLQVSVYPNPTYGILNIDLDQEIDKQVEVNILSLSGVCVYQTYLASKNSQIILSNLSKGDYILQIYLPNNTYTKIITKL